LSVGGLAVLVYSLRQTDKSLKESRRGNRVALLAERRTRREAKEATRLSELAIENAKAVSAIELRPWVVLSMVVTTPMTTDDATCTFGYKVVMKNVGSTPAKNITLLAGSWDKSNINSEPPRELQEIIYGIDILPNEEIEYQLFARINPPMRGIFVIPGVIVRVEFDVSYGASDHIERLFAISGIGERGGQIDGFPWGGKPVPNERIFVRVEARSNVDPLRLHRQKPKQ